VHELSIAHGIVDVVTESARAAGVARIRTVNVNVGRLSGVEAGALEFSYDLVVADTMLAGSRLVIQDVPIVIFCAPCNSERELPGVQRFRCPVCDTPSGDIRRGRDLDVASIEVWEEPAVTT
jgi:hydrogenase nickel incorporation protein HypA/HybF